MSGFRRYVTNAAVLVGAGLLMRSVSLAFNAYVSTAIGAEGMGLFALVMSVYGFAVTFATSGINLAVTRLCAEVMGAGDPGAVGRVVRRGILHACLFGGTASLVLFAFAGPIGAGLLGDARTVPSLRLLAVSMLPIALSSVLSGYFNAVRRVSRNALTQLFEQSVRIGLTVYALLALGPGGIEYACLALVGGSAVAELSSFFFLLVQYLFDRRRHFRDTRPPSSGGLWGRMLRVSMPVAASAYVRSGLVTAEHILIPLCLAMGGASRSEALASYGVLHSMAIPLILYPTAVTGAFAGLLVPEMAESRARGEMRRVRYMTERAMTFTLLFGIGCAGLLSAFSSVIGEAFYSSAEAGYYIRLLAPVVAVMYLDTTVDSILKGLGYQVYSMGVNIADSLLSLLLVYLLLPRMGAEGYVLVITLAEVFNFSLSVIRLHNALGFRLPLWRTLLAPLLAAVGATSLIRLLLPASLPGAPISALVLAALLYILLLLPLGCFTRADLGWLGTLFVPEGRSVHQKPPHSDRFRTHAPPEKLS